MKVVPSSSARPEQPEVIIVTGASSGIGRATALRLAGPGRTLVLAARRADQLAAVCAEIERAGGEAMALTSDVGRLDDIERLVEAALALTGRIDVLVNVAGISRGSSIMTGDEQLKMVLDVNLLGPIRLMRAVVPGMRSQGYGSIVNIGSVAGEIGVVGSYSASKFGLRGVNDSVRRELIRTGVGVTLIEPGFIATEMTAGRTALMPGPEIVARAVERALVRPRRRVVVPAGYRLGVFFSNAFPGVVDLAYAVRARRTAPDVEV